MTNKTPHIRNKKLWKEEDWDSISFIHKWHRKLTGIVLNDSMVKFYVFVFVISLLSAMFLK